MKSLKNKHIEIIDNKFSTIFKVENFFDIDTYEELKKNYPVIIPKKKNLNKIHPFAGTLKHHEIDNKDGIDFRPKVGTEEKHEFNQLLNENKTLRKIDEIFNSEYFFNFFIKHLKFKTVFDQRNLIRKIKYLRPALNSKKINNNFLNKFVSNISINYSYTSMENKGFLRPHSDSPRKYISLLMYFPDENCDDINYGTSFWSFQRGNYNNVPIINEADFQNFKKNSKLIYRTPFIKNCFFGFIRSDFSWHSVEPIDVKANYIRKTLTVNFMYDN